MSINEILNRCKEVLKNYYGAQLQGLIVYGSTARKRADPSSGADPSSDIDLLVLLSKPFNHFQELRRITDLLYPLQLESEQLISAKPAALDEFESGEIQLYRNAKREGMAV